MQSRYVLIAWCTQQNREFRFRNAKFIHHNFNRNGDAIVMSLQATVAHYKKPNVRFNKVPFRGKLRLMKGWNSKRQQCWKNDFRKILQRQRDERDISDDCAHRSKNRFDQKFISEFQNPRFQNEALCKAFLVKMRLCTHPLFKTKAWGNFEKSCGRAVTWN